jgi:citrate lyase beta subunit
MTGFCRRSQLVTPASSEKLLEKALTIDCDSLVIDLEDAVAPTFKHEARQVLRRALARAEPGRRELCVRINGLETPWCLDDLLALEGLPIDTVVVPKVQGPEDLYVYDQLLRQLELRDGRRGLMLLALIESAGGVENALSIARASRRCQALIFGVGDFIAQTGMAFDEQTLLPVRSRIVTAAACRPSIMYTPMWRIAKDWCALLRRARSSASPENGRFIRGKSNRSGGYLAPTRTKLPLRAARLLRMRRRSERAAAQSSWMACWSMRRFSR